MIVIGITWYVYEDYVHSSSAQQLQQPGQTENKVTEDKNGTTVQGTVEIAPKSNNGILIVPAE